MAKKLLYATRRKDFIGACKYMVRYGVTIRTAAERFHLSKSTLHKFIHEGTMSEELYEKLMNLMAYHTQIRHIRGGEATKKKYARIRRELRRRLKSYEDEIKFKVKRYT